MRTSIVKWFDTKKGYGFISHPKDGDDVFVHYSNINSDEDFKTLEGGDRVRFELNDGPKGLHALDVETVDEAADTPSEEEASSTIGPEDVDPTADVNPSATGHGSSSPPSS